MPVSPRSRPDDAAERLRPYTFHGLDLTVRGNQATGNCPFCGACGKFSVEITTTKFRCWVCGAGGVRGGGNALAFTRLLYDRAAEANVAAANGNRKAFLETVAADRRLLFPATVAAWGICLSTIDGRTWLVPGYSVDSRLNQVYRRVRIQDKGEWVWRLMPTPGVWPDGKSHALYLPIADFDQSRPNIFVCEGPWDGMALWEVWDRSTDHNSNIVAVPGCNVWRDEWTEMCRGKCVTLMYDSDHPREYTPGRISRAGYDGMMRVAKRLSGVAKSVRYIRWGPEGYDASKESGWDIRDHLTSS